MIKTNYFGCQNWGKKKLKAKKNRRGENCMINILWFKVIVPNFNCM